MSETDRYGNELRDWQPGDGLRCSYSKRSPVPCGRPVKTALVTMNRMGQKVTRKRVLCANHVAGRTDGPLPGEVRATAERTATQRLIADHWDTFEQYVAEELRKAYPDPPP